jgi:Tol biopolymer transport system component
MFHFRPGVAQRSRWRPLAALSLLLALSAAPVAAGASPSTEYSLYLPTVLIQFPLRKIVYESDHDGDPEIYVMNSDGSAKTRLTDNTATDEFPSFSPDGTRIAFTSDRDGGYNIYVMHADGSNPVRLTTTSADLSPTWSPDGSHIAFQSFRDGGASEIYAMQADGGDPMRLTHTAGAEETPEYSPDGARILYGYLSTDFFNHTMQGEIYAMSADGSNPTRLTFSQFNDFYARWSPDGNRIAFFSQRPPGGIFVMEANGNNVTPLVGGDEPDWSPDGQQIAFYAGGGIAVADADGSHALNITAQIGEDSWPHWQP